MAKPCPHPPCYMDSIPNGWYCTKCKRDVSDEHGNAGIEVGHLGIHGTSDPDDIPAEFQYRHPLRRKSGPDEERREARYVQSLKDGAAPHAKAEGRIKKSIPVELFYGKIRQTGDRHYWQDPANTRKHKQWDVTK